MAEGKRCCGNCDYWGGDGDYQIIIRLGQKRLQKRCLGPDPDYEHYFAWRGEGRIACQNWREVSDGGALSRGGKACTAVRRFLTAALIVDSTVQNLVNMERHYRGGVN